MLDCRQRLLFGVSIGEDAVQTVEENVVGKEGEEKKHRQDDIQPQMSGDASAQAAESCLHSLLHHLEQTFLFHRLRVLMSLFSTISNPSILKPFGLSSLRLALRERVLQPYGHETALGHIGGTDNHLPGIRPYRIGIAVEVTEYAVHLYDLIDISRHDTVVVPFL